MHKNNIEGFSSSSRNNTAGTHRYSHHRHCMTNTTSSYFGNRSRAYTGCTGTKKWGRCTVSSIPENTISSFDNLTLWIHNLRIARRHNQSTFPKCMSYIRAFRLHFAYKSCSSVWRESSSSILRHYSGRIASDTFHITRLACTSNSIVYRT